MAEEKLEELIVALLEQQAPGKTICPSDAARAAGTAETWRDLMDPVREAAGRLVDRGEIEVTQHGEVVHLADAKGPIRLRRVGLP